MTGPVCTGCAGFGVNSWLGRFPGTLERIECEKRCYWRVKAFRHPLEFLKRRRVSPAFNQAQKVDRHARHFCKLFLSLVHLGANLPNPPPELLAQFSQKVSCTWRESGVISFRVPPNEITGRRLFL